jgi:anaerobic magnesium-protoporphyrin IX monomethyl ester cyclase
MNVLFISLLSPHREVWGLPFGPASLSASLALDGHRTSHLIGPGFGEGKVCEAVRKNQAGLVCLSSMTDFIGQASAVASTIWQEFDIPVVLGGIHATMAPEEAVNLPGVSAICLGEGEEALREFVGRLQDDRDTSGVRNFWSRAGGSIIRNPLRPLVRDLDTLPFPDRENFDYEGFLGEIPFGLEFMASRGCRFDCGFCANRGLRSLYGGAVCVRRRSVDNLLKEVRQVSGMHPGAGNVCFHDDLFTDDREWLEEFAKRYPDEVGLPFRVNTHASLLDDESARLLREAGCAEVAIGVETGDEMLRREILRKDVGDGRIIAAFRSAHRAGIQTRAFNMIGIPGETEESLRRTVEFNRILGATHVNAPFFRPYPGTVLYERCASEGLLSGKPVWDPLNETMLKLPTVAEKRVYFYKRAFKFMVRHPWSEPLLNALDRVGVGGWSAFTAAYSLKRTLSHERAFEEVPCGLHGPREDAA